MFLNKTNEEKVEIHFKEFTVKYLSALAGKEIKIAKVESNLLSEQKYSLYCEAEFKSKDEWNEIMASKDGRVFNNDLADFHSNVTIIFVEY